MPFKKGQKPWIMGKHHSEETRRKIGITQKGKILSEEHKKKISIKNKGRIVSEETKRKYRITMQKRYPDGIKRTEEQKKKMRGFKHSEETKRKLSESHKGKGLGKDNPMFGKKQSPEFKKKMSERMKGKNHPNYGKHPFSEKTLRKMSESHKGFKPSEETKRKHSERMKGKKNPMFGKPRTEEEKKKISENRKGIESWFKGKHHSEETKRKLSESKKGKVSGKDNPMFGKKHTSETRKIIRKKRWDQVVPTKDTKFELSIQSLLREKGIKFEKHKSILGQPDIFIKPNLCIFLDGDFHHANPSKYSDDAIIWNERISKTSGKRVTAITAKMIQEKDKRIREELRAEGKKIIEGWYSDWEKDKEKFFQKILKAIKEAKSVLE